MHTWHIHIAGQIQGVGFRPFVYLLAQKFKLKGSVNNTISGVQIEFNAIEKVAKDFYQQLIKNAPVLAKITQHQLLLSPQKSFADFQIIHSDLSGATDLLITPDFGCCQYCQADISANSNRRYDYPFTTCTHCGPRYSILTALPYDRERTTMAPFSMCENCQAEYDDPINRRYYSQTNSCVACGIQMTLWDGNQQVISTSSSSIIDLVCSYWTSGSIIGIKGIGGYLLTCDASNESAIQLLRKRKDRPSKPFALMYPNMDAVKKDLSLSDSEENALENTVSPIVLLGIKAESTYKVSSALAPNLTQMGVLLPYTPLFVLLLKKFQKPIVATSGNISNASIIFEDKKALNELTGLADFVVTNNRPILVPQDDSVLKFSTFKKQKIIIRRSRGLAPTYVNPQLQWSDKNILATGAMLKSTFSFLHQNNTYISQYLGDLGHFDAEENYKHAIHHFLSLLKAKPEVLLADKHPEYATTLFAEYLSKDLAIPIEKIQHHIAHFGAVLGENNLIHAKDPILGVIWDGTGLGADNQIWGGEFFKYENYDFIRAFHFDYFDFILGDKMPKEPRISALAACWGISGMEAFLKKKFTNTEWQIYTKILSKENPLKTSSVGRIFDALAALLDILDQQTYEGEAAMQLEQLATDYFKEHGLDFSSSYFSEEIPTYRLPTKSLMTSVIMDLQEGKTKGFIAAKFHYSLMHLIKIIANNLKIKQIAFSGGVFQNGLLVDLIQHHLAEEFTLFFHQQLSPNDENISFGQLIVHQINQLKKHS